MLKVYSESLMDLQDYLKNVEINGNRGIVYSMVAEVLINLSLLALEAAYDTGEIKPNAYDRVITSLSQRYRCLSEPTVREEVRRVVLLVLDHRKDLFIKIGYEILNTSDHGQDLVYNVVDLVACQYWFTQPTEQKVGNL